MTQTVTPAAGESRRGSHDWHNPEYVREWVEDNEARIESRRAQLDLITDFIPHPSDAPISILDVGAGWGPVTRHLLQRFPAARATLFDYSDEMFAEARRLLSPFSDRLWFVKGDLSQSGALDAAVHEAGAPFDAIVSSSCIHNVRPTERVPALYSELRAATAAGGCFLNLDMVGVERPEIESAWRHARIEQYRRRQHDETGTLPSWSAAVDALEVERQQRAERRAAHDPGPEPAQPTFTTSGGQSRTLENHLQWLHEAGFDAVDCFWRQENRALIGGYRQR